jgi:hypothetical protein
MPFKSKPPVVKNFLTKVEKDQEDKWAHNAVEEHKLPKQAIAGLKRAKPSKVK